MIKQAMLQSYLLMDKLLYYEHFSVRPPHGKHIKKRKRPTQTSDFANRTLQNKG